MFQENKGITKKKEKQVTLKNKPANTIKQRVSWKMVK